MDKKNSIVQHRELYIYPYILERLEHCHFMFLIQLGLNHVTLLFVFYLISFSFCFVFLFILEYRNFLVPFFLLFFFSDIFLLILTLLRVNILPLHLKFKNLKCYHFHLFFPIHCAIIFIYLCLCTPI